MSPDTSPTPQVYAAAPPAAPDIGFREFVAMIAAIMAVNALAIDAMLPALPKIGESVGIVIANQRQWIITAYLLGFGAAQLVYGPLADRFGRKRVILAGMGIYVFFSLISALSTTFEMLMIARVLQGVGAAGARVLAVSIVRDRYSGRQMARVMSLAFIVFLTVPIIAPSLGQIVMLFLPWRWIFGFLCLYGAAVMLWIFMRLPETIHAEDRTPITVATVAHAFKLSLTNRIAVGYTLALTVIVGGLFGFINSAQQVFVDVFHEPRFFTVVFALIAGTLAVSSLLNSRIVGKHGMRVVSHGALCGFIVLAAIHAAVTLAGFENIWTFAVLQSSVMFCFGLMGPNFGTMAMDPLGHVAGTASSVQGFISTVVGALLGFFVGQQFNGSAIPLTLGFVGFGLGGLVIVLITEKGRLFQSTLGGNVGVKPPDAATSH